MKRIFASFGWMLLLLPLISVAGARTAFAINNNAVVTEDRNVSGFTGISSGGFFKVYISFGQKESLRIEGKEETLKEIETTVENGVLKIKLTKNSYLNSMHKHSPNPGPVNVYITAITLTNLNSSGSGDIKINGLVKTDKLATTVSGSGSIDLEMEVSSLTASISGSGHITAAGTTKSSDVKVSGSGHFRGQQLRTDNSDVKVSGSGNIILIADNELNAAISGSGHVRYGGNAKVTTNKSGSGRVSRL